MQATAVMPECDLQLLRRLSDSADADAFAEIVRRYTGVVFSASLRILGDEARAQDVSQETFFRLLRQPKLVSQSLGGWLHRSATHLAIDVKRSERSRKQREKTYWQNHDRLTDRPDAHEPTWEQVSPYVDAALNEIPDPTRSLLIRHFLQGVPQQDLAAELNCSPATVSRRIKAGVELLQQGLRRRGVYVALGALGAFCLNHAAKATPPPALLAELGKMQMAGPVGFGPIPPASLAPSSLPPSSLPLAPAPGPNPPASWPSHLLRPRAELVPNPAPLVSSKLVEAGGPALLACMGTLAVAALLGVLMHSSMAIPATPPARPASSAAVHHEAPHVVRSPLAAGAPTAAPGV